MTSSDGCLYYVEALDRIYVRIYDKKGIALLYDPNTNHQLSMKLGKRLCDWTNGLPTKSDLEMEQMINPSFDANKFAIQYRCIELFLRRFKEWKEEVI